MPSLVLRRRGLDVATAEPSPEEHSGGELVRLAYRLVLPEPGCYQVQLSGGSVLTDLAVGPVAAVTPVLVPTVGRRRPLAATFGGAIHLDGFALSKEELRPGEELCVALFWHSEAPLSEPYTVFVHLLGESFNAAQGNFLWGQHDGQPGHGSRPVPSWRPNEVIEDGHCFTVDPRAPAGTYLIEVGLYDRATGQRLSVTRGGEGDRIILGTVEVLPR